MFSFVDALDIRDSIVDGLDMDDITGDDYTETIATDTGLVYVYTSPFVGVFMLVDMTALDTGVVFYTGTDATAAYDFFIMVS